MSDNPDTRRLDDALSRGTLRDILAILDEGFAFDNKPDSYRDNTNGTSAFDILSNDKLSIADWHVLAQRGLDFSIQDEEGNTVAHSYGSRSASYPQQYSPSEVIKRLQALHGLIGGEGINTRNNNDKRAIDAIASRAFGPGGEGEPHQEELEQDQKFQTISQGLEEIHGGYYDNTKPRTLQELGSSGSCDAVIMDAMGKEGRPVDWPTAKNVCNAFAAAGFIYSPPLPEGVPRLEQLQKTTNQNWVEEGDYIKCTFLDPSSEAIALQALHDAAARSALRGHYTIAPINGRIIVSARVIEDMPKDIFGELLGKLRQANMEILPNRDAQEAHLSAQPPISTQGPRL